VISIRVAKGLVHVGVAVAVAALAACGTGRATESAPTPVAAGTSPRQLARGDSLFHASSCVTCHGRTGKGTAHGPDLTSGQFVQIDGSYADIVKIITTGVPEAKIMDPSFPEPMPPRGGGTPVLSDDEIRALAAYVYSLSHR
jgi:mono/diheme cytochrome c family protein